MNTIITTIVPVQYEDKARELFSEGIIKAIPYTDNNPSMFFPRKAGKNGVVTHKLCQIKFPTHLLEKAKNVMKEYNDRGFLFINNMATINTSPDELIQSVCIVESTIKDLLDKLGLEVINV